MVIAIVPNILVKSKFDSNNYQYSFPNINSVLCKHWKELNYPYRWIKSFDWMLL